MHCRAAAVGLVVAVLDDLAVGAAGSLEAVVDGPVAADGGGKSRIKSADRSSIYGNCRVQTTF